MVVNQSISVNAWFTRSHTRDTPPRESRIWFPCFGFMFGFFIVVIYFWSERHAISLQQTLSLSLWLCLLQTVFKIVGAKCLSHSFFATFSSVFIIVDSRPRSYCWISVDIFYFPLLNQSLKCLVFFLDHLTSKLFLRSCHSTCSRNSFQEPSLRLKEAQSPWSEFGIS